MTTLAGLFLLCLLYVLVLRVWQTGGRQNSGVGILCRMQAEDLYLNGCTVELLRVSHLSHKHRVSA
jgi:hypothetical protein